MMDTSSRSSWVTDQSSDSGLAFDHIPPILTPVNIVAVGAAGYHGSIPPFYESPSAGSAGSNGTSPSPGSPGQDIEIGLRYTPDNPAFVEVTRHNHANLQISKEERLYLDAHGGNGGNGGVGGAGGDGATGQAGAQGENGGTGGAGGNGGYGTDGAPGGKGGNVLIDVYGDELDLLLAVDLNANVRGGIGGKAGTHGVPGKGGMGGPGGPSYKTYDSEGNSTRHSGGRQGRQGPAGWAPSTSLHSGLNGPSGQLNIHVISDDENVGSYNNRYHLIVDSFDTVDENNDGINEPGEYLIIENITIRNDGPMVSPSGQHLKMVIRESVWLKPDTSAPLIFPDSIPPNGRAVIPGKLKAFICHETVPRLSGEALNVHETVALLGYSERLLRSIPEFSGGVPIIIQYPLQLPRPIYMDCMERCDQMSISWMVNNISKREYGRANDRRMRTKLIDRERIFVLSNATAEESDVVLDDIDQIDPADGCRFGETFKVVEEISDFTTGIFILELYLLDPHSEKLRRIMYYEFGIQISEGYTPSSMSRFLFIINASTENDAIIQTQKFIRTELYVDLDTLNLSLTGTLINEGTHKNALQSYRGKSIIVSGNSFTYFGSVERYNWDLIDPRDARTLLIHETSFLFCGVLSEEAQKSLINWMALVRYPADPEVETTDSPMDHKNRRGMLKSIRAQSSGDNTTLDLKHHQYKLSGLTRMFRRDTEKLMQRNGNDLSKKLDKQAPTRRFVITPEQNATGSLSVIEGLPRCASCIMSRAAIVKRLNVLSPQQEVMIIDSLPFNALVVMFWNIVGSLKTSGIAPTTIYRCLPGFQIDLNLIEKYEYGEEDNEHAFRGLISLKVCQSIAWSMEHALHSDLEQLCQRSSLLDRIRTSNVLEHAPRLQQFLAAIPEDSSTASQEGVDLAVQVLGSLNAALKASNIVMDLLTSVPGLSSRRGKVQRSISGYQKHALSFMAPSSSSKDIKTQIKREAERLAEVMKAKKESPRVNDKIIDRSLKALAGKDYGVEFAVDLVAGDGSQYVDSQTFQKNKIMHRDLIKQQEEDAIIAKELREEVLETLYDTIDYLPITGFDFTVIRDDE